MSRTLRTALSLILLALAAAALWWAGANAHMTRSGESAAENKGAAVVADTPEEEWQTLHGTVVSQEENELIIRTDDGTETEMGLGPLGYWLGHKISLSPNDEVEIRGFVSNDEFEPAEIHNLTTGESIILRNADGSPVWRGEEH